MRSSGHQHLIHWRTAPSLTSPALSPTSTFWGGFALWWTGGKPLRRCGPNGLCPLSDEADCISFLLSKWLDVFFLYAPPPQGRLQGWTKLTERCINPYPNDQAIHGVGGWNGSLQFLKENTAWIWCGKRPRCSCVDRTLSICVHPDCPLCPSGKILWTILMVFRGFPAVDSCREHVCVVL